MTNNQLGKYRRYLFRELPVKVFLGLLFLLFAATVGWQVLLIGKKDEAELFIQGQALEFNAGFVRSMIRHHSSILSFASYYQDSDDENVQMLARLILRTQAYELGRLEGWLIGKDLRVISTGSPMSWVEIPQSVSDPEDLLYQARCRTDPTGMMGNLPEISSFKLKALGQFQAHEDEVKFFLERVRAHHLAALEMSRFAVRYTNSNFVRSTAIEIIKQQSREINWIDQMLAT